MKKSQPEVIVAIGFLMGSFMSAVLASEDNLQIPEHRNSNVVFELKAAPATVTPAEFLKMFVGNIKECCEGHSPMAGRYSYSETRITFDPAFDLIEGQDYTILSRSRNAEGLFEPTLTEFTVQSSVPATVPEVIEIYPSGDDIPENTLRFYIHFSAPMQPHVSTDFIKLVDASGIPDTAAFMAFKQELWSEDRKRLTLLMDPGRIKRGVTGNLELGPALRENNRYSIIVEAGWPSANGRRKAPGFEKEYSISQALRNIPSTDMWTVTPPRTLSRDPLVIEFDRPFDHQLSQSSIRILGTDNRVIPGTITVENHERTWRFLPQQAWTNSKVLITVDARFEDVAGNNFRDLLDHSVDNNVQTINQQTITLKLKPPPG